MLILAAILLGLAAGSRTFLPLAAVALAGWAGWLAAAPVFGWLASGWAAVPLALLALAELAGDKHPRTPSRTQPGAVIARLASGAISGVAVMPDAMLAGVLLGAAAAAASTFACHALRARCATWLRRDLPAALLEDALALVVAGTAVAIAASA